MYILKFYNLFQNPFNTCSSQASLLCKEPLKEELDERKANALLSFREGHFLLYMMKPSLVYLAPVLLFDKTVFQ
jgi:hypothetical protein